MMSDDKIKRVAIMLLFVGVCVSTYFAVMYMMELNKTTSEIPVMSEDERTDMISDQNRVERKAPDQAMKGPYNPSTTMSCASEQLNKLDDCDDDNSPNVGSNWEKYIMNQ